ncbi:Uncharacterised protein [Chlamydia trachomatis]|nr:Uncharacterised protein [Chlamydia trachomatis]
MLSLKVSTPAFSEREIFSPNRAPPPWYSICPKSEVVHKVRENEIAPKFFEISMVPKTEAPPAEEKDPHAIPPPKLALPPSKEIPA